MAKDELSPDLAMAGLLNDPEVDDSEIYKSIGSEEGVEEEDLESLEGEERDEESASEEENDMGEDQEDEYGSEYGGSYNDED